MRGLTFALKNEYSTQLTQILHMLHAESYAWFVGASEAYIVENGQLGKDLFDRTLYKQGEALLQTVDQCATYSIFVDLKAFPIGQRVHDITTYAEFLKSTCEIVFLIVDCMYATLYVKNKQLLQRLVEQLPSIVDTVVPITTDDPRTRLQAF